MNKKSPFQFGKQVVVGKFINRDNDIAWIASNIRSGINTLIMSPRRWGKSSLMQELALRMKRTDDHVRFCFIDVFYPKRRRVL